MHEPGPVVWVVVLGDFGRSPRMQYHTLSLSKAGYTVHVLASPGAALIPELQQAQNVHPHYLRPPPAFVARLPTVLSLAAKVAYQLLLMLWLMGVALPQPRAVLMQNPPAIPVMLLCWLACLRHGAALIIDWHNLAYSIMQLKYSRLPWLISLARWHEAAMGRRAQYSFTVTKAMQAFLQHEFGIQSVVLYDRPPSFFRPASAADKHELLLRLGPEIAAASIGSCLQRYLPAGGSEPSKPTATAAGTAASAQDTKSSSSSSSSTLLTVQQQPGPQASPQLREPRPALVISSTSWTPDEDFGLLLAAAQDYDAAATAAGGTRSCRGSSNSNHPQQQQQQQGQGQYPDVLFVITGRGPQRDMYLQRIRQLGLTKVAFCSLWLEPEDYPKLLACADLGVCLHTSSSGLDLPMKVVDMFGAGLAVAAVEYACIRELVTPGKTGLLFRSAEELGQQLLRLLQGFNGSGGGGGGGPSGEGELQRLREGVAASQLGWRWDDNWTSVALPVFQQACGSSGEAAAGSSTGGSSSKKGSKKAA